MEPHLFISRPHSDSALDVNHCLFVLIRDLVYIYIYGIDIVVKRQEMVSSVDINRE